MKPIKFRTFDKELKMMDYDFYLHSSGKQYQFAETNYNTPHIEIEPCDLELMQSTGLKDKNGVEIYIGDIVILTSKSINYADTYWHNYAEVFQQSNGAYRLRGKGIYETELYGNRKQVTLTGNIYETPELLENDRFCTETDDPDY